MRLQTTLSIARRLLEQLGHDHRTIGLIIFVPCLLIILLKYVFDGRPEAFHALAPIMLGIFPLLMMFLVTSISMLRERTAGTLDRLMTMPISKLDLVFGYAIAFTYIGLIQAAAVSFVTLGVLDIHVSGGTVMVITVAASAAFLGAALGIFVSAFATSEFQAVQLVMPIMMPQILLCGLFVARDQMATVLQKVSNFFPLTYSVDAMKQAAMSTTWTSTLWRDLGFVLGCGVVALALGAATIRRRES